MGVTRRQRAKVVILDGSMGRELCTRGLPEDDLFRKVWSARAIVDEKMHHLVVEAHADFIAKGAEMVTTSNYGVQPNYYSRVFEKDEVEKKVAEHTEVAAKLTRKAVEESGKAVCVLGSLPPLFESHRPELAAKFLKVTGAAEVTRQYGVIAKALIAGGVDKFIVETMNSWDEAMCALDAIKDLKLPILVSLEGSLRDEDLKPQTHLASEIADKVIELKKGGMNIEALGFNCAPPEDILGCLKSLEAAGSPLKANGIELMVYANCNDRKAALDKGFDATEVKAGDVRVRPDLAQSEWAGFAGFCEQFHEHGATYIGGCCGCRPQGIKMLADWAKAAHEEEAQEGEAKRAKTLCTKAVPHPSAWTQQEMAADPSKWTHPLDSYVEELDKCIEKLVGTPIGKITAEQIELPTLGPFLEKIRGDLEGGHGFVRFQGLPTQRWTEEQNRLALWSMGLKLGWCEEQDKAGSLIHDVKNTGMKFGDNATVRYFQTNQAIPFHTDGCDAFALFCLSRGCAGGMSTLASSSLAFNKICERRPDLAEVLQQDFHFDARGQHPDGRLCQVHPVYTYHENLVSMIHKRPYLDSAQRFDEVPKYTELQKEALDMLDAVLEEEDAVLRFELQAGEMVIANNHNLVHGRTSYEDDGSQTRHCLRLWLSLPNGRPLPPHYAETREYCNTYQRRM
jgi:S-methylmethionine-dependent homocysteine/selenocysteine methylase